MKRYPGQVWFLPPELEEGGDAKRRRHVLLTTCDEDEPGVFSFASTQPTEAKFGAAFLLVDPATSPDPGTGLTKPTYVYPSRLVAASPEAFLRIAGMLVKEMPRVRMTLASALGLGTGTAAGGALAEYSWRGCVVELSSRRREAIGYTYGIILTEASYSSSQRYQIIVPMDDARVFEQLVPDDLIVSGRTWLEQVDPALETVLIAVADVQSIFHRPDIERWTGAVIDDGTLNEIEEALKKLFEL